MIHNFIDIDFLSAVLFSLKSDVYYTIIFWVHHSNSLYTKCWDTYTISYSINTTINNYYLICVHRMICILNVGIQYIQYFVII